VAAAVNTPWPGSWPVPKVQAVYVAPGNGGTALDGRLVNVPITDVVALREWAQAEKIG
jgi:phosphoribosylamine--glycine ligase